MNNYESNFNNTPNERAEQWENSLPKENFSQFQKNRQEQNINPESNTSSAHELSDEEIRQILIAKRREQLHNHAEAHEKANHVAQKLLALALAATILVGGAIATRPHEILETDKAQDKIHEVAADEIVFHGNIRNNPETTNSQDPTNILASEEQEVKIVVGDSTILSYQNESDPNGSWYGIPIDLLEDQAFISKGEARKLSKDKDSYAWINHNNASIVEKQDSILY